MIRALALTLATFLLAACGGAGGEDIAPETPAMKTLTGTVAYRERMALPLNAVVTVRLIDISLQDAPARLLGEQTIDAMGKSVPIPFAIDYDPARIDERMSYAVRAEIRGSDGGLLWTTDTVYPVLTRDAPSDDINLVLVRAGG